MKFHKLKTLKRISNAIEVTVTDGCYSSDCIFKEGGPWGRPCICATDLEDLGNQLSREARTIK